ncbi:threonine ammonia-lyase, medium form [Geoglobus ahangari]|uniref:threonine ammonia-lyase n=1 Tax=Geoglobus ahangari TaxID=113653 RepID=A0A0F7IEN6_9EURY|nr:threonine ammonia-lyase [Geoglobus ahangari]AKG92039.1 threonine ammonia-lyase, medium form [Geoglobus ahangari]
MDLVEEIAARAEEARRVISEHVYLTPVDYSDALSEALGADVFLKLENLQKTGSFKIRGALYKVYKIRNDVQGVVAASAGNHALGVAYASRVFGLECVVVMPEFATIAKVEAARRLGAEVVLHGAIYDDAERRAREIAEERGFAFVHPFDDPDIIAGQGTVGLEIAEQLGDVDVVVVPVGGGGLISGISAVLKKINPDVRIVGVEPENAPKFRTSLKAGRIERVEIRPTIADGLVTKRPGKTTFQIVRRLVDSVIAVSEDEIAGAIHFLLEREKVLAEGAGAAGVAALLSDRLDVDGRVAVVVSGGNIDLTAIYRLIIRGLANSGRLAVIRGYVPDSPGKLSEITGIIAAHRGNIIDVIHHREDLRAPAWHTALQIVVEVESSETLDRILEELRGRGYTFERM